MMLIMFPARMYEKWRYIHHSNSYRTGSVCDEFIFSLVDLHKFAFIIIAFFFMLLWRDRFAYTLNGNKNEQIESSIGTFF